jgi:choline dehydrogenase-like flavoprotein
LLHQNHLSRGTISLMSSDPKDPPVIDPRYFSHPHDVRIAVETIKTTIKISRQRLS